MAVSSAAPPVPTRSVRPFAARTATAGAATAADADVVAVADGVSRLMRAFGKIRSQLLAAAEHDVEWSAHMLLKCLANAGAQRSGAIAAMMDTDPSTVSRQVAALVKDGLVERRADPIDGRASLLVLTPKADEIIAAHEQVRNGRYRRLLSDWSERDLRTFARLLARFSQDIENDKDNWIPESATAASAPAEGKH